ncbi:MAG: SDR family oxidoreductase [Bdellovibrionales bacterium]|nr:SDR family oxidoreductase [Bdellovibrionales bacterium]
MAWGLVTGSSSGIGYEFAKVLADEGYDVILVARREDRLLELKTEIEQNYQQKAEVIVADLQQAEEVQRVFEESLAFTDNLEILINNAGFGQIGDFTESDLQRNLDMIDLNVRALTHLSGLYAKKMKASRKGYICNVASTAAFQPGPGMAVYFATKAFVLSFSEALAAELEDHNVFVSALCPGPTISEFGKAAKFSSKGVVGKAKLPSSQEVAEFGYKALIEGRATAIHGTLNNLMAQSNRFVPRSLSTSLTKKMISKA